MQDRPTAAELLQTMSDLLETEVLPAVSGPLQHQVRVAGNLARILEREQRLGPAAAQRTRERIATLLGAADELDLPALYDELTRRLLESDDPRFEGLAWRTLVDITRDKLAIAKPGHDAYDFAPETRS